MKLFLTSSADVVLPKIVQHLPKAPQDLSVAFIPTAAKPYLIAPWVSLDRRKLNQLGFNVTTLDLHNKTKDQVTSALSNVDIVFVAGGNTFYLLEKARECGLDMVLDELLPKGLIYIGSSAGSILVGPDIEPIKIFDNPGSAKLRASTGLNFVDFIVLPHYGRDKYKSHHQKVIDDYGDKYKLIPLRDDQFIIADLNGNHKIY